jgi:hypothetical protein
MPTVRFFSPVKLRVGLAINSPSVLSLADGEHCESSAATAVRRATLAIGPAD